MKKVIVKTGILLLAVFIIVTVAYSAETRVYNFDDLTTGSIPEGWKVMSGFTSGFKVEEGDGSPKVTFKAVEDAGAPGAKQGNKVIKMAEHHGSIYEHGHHLWTDEISFTDGILEVDMMAHSGPIRGHCGIAFRIQDQKNFFAVRFHTSGGNVATSKVKDGKIEWAKKKANTNVKGYDKWYHFKIVVKGANTKVFLDDIQYLDYTDPNPITAAGGVGLYSRGDTSLVSFDNFKITQ